MELLLDNKVATPRPGDERTTRNGMWPWRPWRPWSGCASSSRVSCSSSCYPFPSWTRSISCPAQGHAVHDGLAGDLRPCRIADA